MTMQRIQYLTPEQRKTFSQRLLTLHQVLADSVDENYEHTWIIQHDLNSRTVDDRMANYHSRGFIEKWRERVLPSAQHCGTAACAVGHAVWHHELFPGLIIERDANGRPESILGGVFQVNNYFGPGTWTNIFDQRAYDVPAWQVTRKMAMDRIADYVQNGLGCQLIEESTNEV